MKSREEALRAREERNGSVGGYPQRNGPGQYPPPPQQPYQPNGYAPQFNPQQQPPPQHHHQSLYYNQPGYFNGPPNGYSDQQPPHGLPSGGMPPNQFPPNLKSNGSMTNMSGYPQQQQPMQPQYSGYNQPPRRLNSMPGGINNFQDFQQQPHHQYNPQQQHYGNSPSFNNAAQLIHL